MATKKTVAPKRPYTGNSDPAHGARPGTKVFQDHLIFLFQAKNLGIYANRATRNGKSLSVHATGRAADTGGGPRQVTRILEFLDTQCREALEEIHDYLNLYKTGQHGAAWRCDRNTWRVYDKAPSPIGTGGSWVHWELTPEYADNPQLVLDLFARIFKP